MTSLLTETVFLYVCVINLRQACEIFNVFHACCNFFYKAIFCTWIKVFSKKKNQAGFSKLSNAKLTQGQTQRLLKAFDKTA